MATMPDSVEVDVRLTHDAVKLAALDRAISSITHRDLEFATSREITALIVDRAEKFEAYIQKGDS